MAMEIIALGPTVGAEVRGVDITAPLDAETVVAVRQAWLDHGIVLFRGFTELTPDQHVAFTRQFGRTVSITLKQYDLPENPEVVVISNMKVEGKNVGAPLAYTWHTDGQHMAEPVWGSVLWGREVPPEKGDTLFASMTHAYDALPEAKRRRIDGLRVLHSRVRVYPQHYPDRRPMTEEEKAAFPDVIHPLVRTHPETGRKALYLGGNAGWEIVGRPHEEGRALLAELEAFATKPERIYAHKWRQGDTVFWDNRSTMHCATPYDMKRYSRILQRTTIVGDVPY